MYTNANENSNVNANVNVKSNVNVNGNVCIMYCKIHSSCWLCLSPLLQCWTRAAVYFPSVGHWACRLEPLEPNVVERLDHLCIGMLVYCTHTCILNTASWHVDNCCLHVVIKMLGPNCLNGTIYHCWVRKNISWLNVWNPCTLYKVKCWSKTLFTWIAHVCWTENHCWIQPT